MYILKRLLYGSIILSLLFTISACGEFVNTEKKTTTKFLKEEGDDSKENEEELKNIKNKLINESEHESEEETQENIEEMSAFAPLTDAETPIRETEPLQYNSSQLYTTLYVVNCNQSITLRNAPSTSAAEIRQIPLGASVSFLESSSDGFYKVAYMGNTGYALASYLSTDPASHYVAPTAAATRRDRYFDGYTGYTAQVVNCKVSITLRTIPKTTGPEILQIPLGAIVTVYDEAENGFYYVSYNGYDGFALSSYIDIWY